MVYYHHTDHLGTTEVVTDSSGAIVWEAGYEAFGSVLNEKGDSKFTPSYTGKFFDNASGLYYFNARWYDSELGKFTTQDPIRDGLNWWNYCNGNPITHFDPNGEMEFDVDNGIIYCDLTNGEDMQIASGQYVRFQNEGFSTCIAKDSNSGIYLQFNDSESMVNYVEQNCYDKDYGLKIENFIDSLGSLTTLADTANIPNMSNLSNSLGVLSLFIDASKLKDNPTASKSIDVGIDAVGLVGGIVGSTTVPLLSVYASCVKTEIEWWIQTMAEGTVEFNNMAKQYQHEKMMEEIERYE